MLMDNQEQELRRVAEYGRKAQAAQEVLKDFLIDHRAQVIGRLENDTYEKAEELLTPVIYLRMLRVFELEVEKYISLGEIAERRLNENVE